MDILEVIDIVLELNDEMIEEFERPPSPFQAIGLVYIDPDEET